jgi:hypothetical protein
MERGTPVPLEHEISAGSAERGWPAQDPCNLFTRRDFEEWSPNTLSPRPPGLQAGLVAKRFARGARAA